MPVVIGQQGPTHTHERHEAAVLKVAGGMGLGRDVVRVFILVLTAVLGPSVAACSGQASGTASPPPETFAPAPTSAAPTSAPTTAPTKTSAPTPALPAPAALQGRWRAVIEPGPSAGRAIATGVIRRRDR